MEVLSVRVFIDDEFQSSSNLGRLETPPLNWVEEEPVEGTLPVMIAALTVILTAWREV